MKYKIITILIILCNICFSQIAETSLCKIDLNSKMGGFPYSVDYFIALDTSGGIFITFEKTNSQKDYILYHYNNLCRLEDSMEINSPNGINGISINRLNKLTVVTKKKQRKEVELSAHKISLDVIKSNSNINISYEAKDTDCFIDNDSNRIVIRKGQVDAYTNNNKNLFHIVNDNFVPFYTKILFFDNHKIILQFGRVGIFFYDIEKHKLLPISKEYSLGPKKLHWDFASNPDCQYLIGIADIQGNNLSIVKYSIPK